MWINLGAKAQTVSIRPVTAVIEGAPAAIKQGRNSVTAKLA